MCAATMVFCKSMQKQQRPRGHVAAGGAQHMQHTSTHSTSQAAPPSPAATRKAVQIAPPNNNNTNLHILFLYKYTRAAV